jgi:tetratricopeptide (TPR) repeat protein
MLSGSEADMMKKRGKISFMKSFLCTAIIVSLSLLLSSCFFIKQGPDRASLSKTAQDYLKAHEYQKALEAYHSAWNQHLDDTQLGNDYMQATENIKRTADYAYEKEKFSSAGYLYNILLQYFPNTGMLAGSLSFSKDALRLGMKNCSKHLNVRGLEEYRRGNLRTAISTWKSILLFDAQNAEVKKAIQTASTQLRNLEKNF